ncbi:IS3 family transposase [Micromonospora sp. NPDC049460]|uniref:IS3 family transposase n=1 Tax=Micromonospora sp. NPDC049460 TaxID=3364272 RepID=UPI0037BAC284
MKVEIVDSQRSEHGVQPVLQALESAPAQIAPSAYYAAKTRPASARSLRDSELTEAIEQVHADNYDVYGARKIWHELRYRGVPGARCTVERLGVLPREVRDTAGWWVTAEGGVSAVVIVGVEPGR